MEATLKIKIKAEDNVFFITPSLTSETTCRELIFFLHIVVADILILTLILLV